LFLVFFGPVMQQIETVCKVRKTMKCAVFGLLFK